MSKIILIHDEIKGLDPMYFKSNFSNVELVKQENFKSVCTPIWKEVTYILDGTSKKMIYKALAKGLEEKMFYTGSNFVDYKGKKVLSIPDLRVYAYCNNAESFDVRTRNEFKVDLDNIKDILKLISNTTDEFKRGEEKRIELEATDLFGKGEVYNFNSIVPRNEDEENFVFIKDSTEVPFTPDGNVIDVNGFLILKELKNIFMHKI